MSIIYSQLTRIVQLTRLAWFGRYLGIRIRWAVMRVITQKFRTNLLPVFILLYSFYMTWHTFVSFALPSVLLFYLFMLLYTYLVFRMVVQLSRVTPNIIYNFLFQQAIHTRIGFDKSAIYTLTLTTNHTLSDTFA